MLRPRRRDNRQDPVTVPQALALAACVIDYERLEPRVLPLPPQYRRELDGAREILGAMLSAFREVEGEPALLPERRPLESGHKRPERHSHPKLGF